MYHKIISLVPSLTELLIDLGLKDHLAGRTRFCVHPEAEVETIPIVGGTKNPRIDKITAIEPDVIVANKEENRKKDIEKLQQHFGVEMTEIATIQEALSVIHQLGDKFNVATKADRLIAHIKALLRQRPDGSSLRTAYFIWKDPWMTVGGDTYISDVMEHWGLTNIFGDEKRYPELTLDALSRYDPDLLLLSSEPYPFKKKHIPEVQKACPHTQILLVDGEWFSWYGSRMRYAFKALNEWRQNIVI